MQPVPAEEVSMRSRKESKYELLRRYWACPAKYRLEVVHMEPCTLNQGLNLSNKPDP